jgi:hypothetical protein
MSKSLTVILALAAGLAGGMLSRYIAPPAAHAQASQRQPAEIRAQSFVLVDSANRTIGTFTFDPRSGPRILNVPNGGAVTTPSPTRIVLRDAAGREIWSAGGNGIHPASER